MTRRHRDKCAREDGVHAVVECEDRGTHFVRPRRQVEGGPWDQPKSLSPFRGQGRGNT